MRLSEWRANAPRKEMMSNKVMAAIDSALDLLGADPDPDCWVAWGDDPAIRYSILVTTPAGLLQVSVRVNVPGEGPRATGKLTRWHRVQTGEFAVEVIGGHRIVNFQLEGQVLKGTDETADAVSSFILAVYDAIDGRTGVVALADGVVTARPARRPRSTMPQLPAPKGTTS